MSKYVNNTAAAKSVSGYVILKNGKPVAKVLAHHTQSRCLVNVSHYRGDTGFQHKSTGGYGYDKFTAALSGLVIDGHEMTDHCGAQLNPPRGMKFFPTDYKPRRGYTLANYGRFNRQGVQIHSYHWQDMARESLSADAEWSDVLKLAKELESAAELTAGYSSCYRDSGLKYLESIGYQVLQVI